MPGFNHRPPSPRLRSCRPSYPRLLGLGMLVLTAACGGNVAEPSSAEGTGGTGAVAGGIEPPFDAAVDSTGGTGNSGGTGGTGDYGGYGGGSAGGTGGYSYDADVPSPDAGPDAEPPPDGDIAPPWDAGQEGWDAQIDAEPPDAELAGGEPAPFDAATCEASFEPY